MANIKSQWYPYNKVYEGYFDLSQTLNIPRKIMNYILDMPDGTYTPIDDDKYSRTRLWKYLYYDGARPLDNPLPTPKEKMSVLFNPDKAETPPTDKGYRLIPQFYVKPSQTDAQTRIYCYMGRTIADSEFKVQLSVVFDIWTHFTEEATSKTDEAYSRVFAIEQAIIEAFHGVNMAGVGTFYFNRTRHSDCGSTTLYDRDTNIGRRVVLGLEVASETLNGNIENNEVPLGNSGLFFG